MIQEALEQVQHRRVPEWLELNTDKQEGVAQALPDANQVAADIQTQLIIELYSK